MKRDQPLEWHPYAAMFPLMDEESLQELADDIRENGQLEQIIVNADDLVVDGRNRLVACQRAGVEPRIERRSFTDVEAFQFVLSANLHRRHLTPSQRASIAARMANMKQGGSGSNQHKRKEREFGVSRAMVARAMNVSERSVHAASVVHRQGIGDVRVALEAGQICLSKAEKIARASSEDQERLFARAMKIERRRLASETSSEFDVSAASESLKQSLRSSFDRWPTAKRKGFVRVLREMCDELHAIVYEVK